jgi:hypothetical protein
MTSIRYPDEPVRSNHKPPRGLPLFKTDFELGFESDFHPNFDNS